MSRTLRIATRESRLALWQAEHVAQGLCRAHPSLTVELVPMTTRGDQILDRTLSKVGGKGLFIKELETAMRDGRAELAVHSMKDVPAELPEGFVIGAILDREDAHDALVSPRYSRLQDVPSGSVIGTSSLRRQAQLRHARPDLAVEPLRGNVETRLKRLDEGRFAAILLAAAGLKRLGLAERIAGLLPEALSLPAVGQGAVGIECLAEDHETRSLVAALDDEHTRRCVEAERAFAEGLGASCESPIAAYATLAGEVIYLKGLAAARDGGSVLRGEHSGAADAPREVGAALARDFLARGAAELIAGG